MATNTLAIFMALALQLFYSNVSAAGHGSPDFGIQTDSRPKINSQNDGFEKKLSAAKTVKPETNVNNLGEFQYSQTDFYEGRPVLSQQKHDLNSLKSDYTVVLDQRPGNINQNQVKQSSYGNVQISQPKNNFDFSSVQNNENNSNFDDKFAAGRTPKTIEGVEAERQVQSVQNFESHSVQGLENVFTGSSGSVNHGVGSNGLKATESADEIANRRGRFRIVKNPSERHGENKLIVENKYTHDNDAFSVESNVREEYELSGNKLNTQEHNKSPVRSETEQQNKFPVNSNTQGKVQISWGDLMTEKPNQFYGNSNTHGQNQFSPNSNTQGQNQFSGNSNTQGRDQISWNDWMTQKPNQVSANNLNTQKPNQFSANSNNEEQNKIFGNSNTQGRDQISWGDLMTEKPNQLPVNSNTQSQGQTQFFGNEPNNKNQFQLTNKETTGKTQNEFSVTNGINSFPSSKIIEQRPSLGPEKSSGSGSNFQNKINAVYSSNTNKRSENLIQDITSTTESTNFDLMASFPNFQSQSFVSNSMVGVQGLTRTAAVFSGLEYRSSGLEN